MVKTYWIHPLNLVTDKELDEVAKTGNEYRDSMEKVIKLSELNELLETLIEGHKNVIGRLMKQLEKTSHADAREFILQSVRLFNGKLEELEKLERKLKEYV